MTRRWLQSADVDISEGGALTVGGSAGIMACAAARLGLRTALAGVVGDDAGGRFMIDEVARRGVDVGAVAIREDLATGLTVALARGDGPAPAVMALGYAGWEAGQLEDEIRSNTWLNVPVDETIIFDVPFEQRWQSAARLLGVDLGRIATQAGHA